MSKKQTVITAQGISIRVVIGDTENYLSLTDIAKKRSARPAQTIFNWLRTRNTIEYLGAWEALHNPDFNVLEFEYFRNNAGLNSFTISASEWIEKTNAVGIKTKSGRYGGTYAHQEIALGTLSKINYTVHTDAIKEELIPPRIEKGQGFIYAGEADILNVAVFGMTAKMWRTKNKNAKGNIRDYATPEQLLILSNLEAVNAELIRMKLSQDERIDILNQAGIKQMKSLISSPSLPQLPNDEK